MLVQWWGPLANWVWQYRKLSQDSLFHQHQPLVHGIWCWRIDPLVRGLCVDVILWVTTSSSSGPVSQEIYFSSLSVLQDLAVFKSSAMMWYFCMREWKSAAQLDNDWISAVHNKLKSLLFHLREYLLTCNPERRRMILRCIYEDFSDSNQVK